MKIAPVLLGAVFAQSSGDSEEVFESDDRWDSWGSDNTFLVNSEGKAYAGTYDTADRKTVQAVTCWESNNMGDLAHYNTQNDDGFGWSNIHHGHDQAANQAHISTDDSDYQIGTYVDGQTTSSVNKQDLHSLLAYDNRYSGCIYEVPDWVYSATSYNIMWQVRYGYSGSALDATGIDSSVATTLIRTNWWHYFNAHVVISDDATDTNDARLHYIAMANPSYEGLGYLNFIATYAKASTNDFTTHAWQTRNAKNFNTQDTVTDLYSGGYAFDIIPGDTNAQWYSTYDSAGTATATAGAWTSFAAVSSFPHNDLGKDFRFNVRVLHKGGDGDPSDTNGKDSYYFYRINDIEIKFPYTVRCPREATHIATDIADSIADTFRCMDSAGYNGHRAWDKATTNTQTTDEERENLPVYIETLADGLPGAPTAAMCTTEQADGRWYKCGSTYSVTGLLNTYDEHSQQEFGAHQEFWFQFEYHFEFTTLDASISATTNTDHKIYNLPNILFNAFELKTVTFACSNADQSRNRCK